MARYELTKTIEARKLNQRSGLPLNEPPVSVPYSAILDNVEESWDLVKFRHLGVRYQCATTLFKEAARLYGAEEREGEPVMDSGPVQAEPAGDPSAPRAAARDVLVKWEELSSSHQSVLRAKVPGGWLVAVRGSGVTFLPDEAHTWTGRTVE
jgi:hypothetical protein